MKRWMCGVFVLASCSTSMNASSLGGSSGGGGESGGYGAPQTSQSVPADDAAIIIPAAESFMKDCGDCVAPGFDFRARTVAVSGADQDMRNKWLKEIYDPNGAEYSSYSDVLKRCEWATPPEIQIDMAVVKFWQVNQLAPPMQNVFNGFADTCGNPPNPAVKALVQKVKKLHFRAARNWPMACPSGSCGYEYELGADGTLVIGVHNEPVNTDVETARWLKQHS